MIERVKEDIKKLHERFKNKYVNSQASVMSNLRDLPPVSGAIIWARQIERQLKTYMRRVEDVLGKKWELDIQGQQLKADFDQFRKKLNADHVRRNIFHLFIILATLSNILFRSSSNGFVRLKPELSRCLVAFWTLQRKATLSLWTSISIRILSPFSKKFVT